MLVAALAKLYSGRDEEAVARLNRSVERNPNTPQPHFFLAAALAHLGRGEEAREQARSGLELNLSFTIARVRAWVFSDNPILIAGRERVYDGLRKAGLPEE
jgi:hypothetical protein